MHEVHGGAGLRCELRRGADRDLLGFGGTALGEVPHRIVTGGVQVRCGPRDDRVILGMDRNEHPRLRGGAQEADVVRDPLVETRRDHEHLESAMSVSRERRQLTGRRVARIRDNDMEREVRERPLRIAQAALDAGPQRAILIDHRAHGGHATRDRGTRAVFEVVEWRERRGAREMRVEVDAAREHELPRRIELARGTWHFTDRGDASVLDTHIRAPRATRGHDSAAADRCVGQSVSSSRLERRSASSCCASASIMSSMSPSMRRSRFDRL